MNIAFVCTGEFEPFLYECIAQKLRKDGNRIFYVAFFLDTRRAVRKIKQSLYPQKISRSDLLSGNSNTSQFSAAEIEEIVSYDWRRREAVGNKADKPRLMNQAAYYEAVLRDFYCRQNINAVVVWNYFPTLVNVACRTARGLNLKTVFFENGPFPGTLLIDAKGVNFQSSLTENSRQFYESLEAPPQNWQRDLVGYESRFRQYCRANKGIMNPLAKFYYALLMRNRFYRQLFPDLADDSISGSLRKKICSRCLSPGEDKLPEQFIFLPFQYSDDTQVLMNSPEVSSMESFLKTCYTAVKSALPGYQVVVKEHPDDFGRKHYRGLRKQYPDALWLARHNITELVQKARAVITLNSSVGVEALRQHKPVITLGKSLYNVDGVVYHVENVSNLASTINRALATPVNSGLIDKFLYYLRFKYLVEGSPRYCNADSLEGACLRIKKILAAGTE